ncbi:P-loop containing nucleoside triphosphate hydrolase protein [Mycena leptocephala]|nr:P-loop containing nucleoside triphosphate hydrolase protein [Mycena leptocephala]
MTGLKLLKRGLNLGDMIFANYETTGEPRALRLRAIHQDHELFTHKVFWHLACEYLEAADAPPGKGQQFGLATHRIRIGNFDGVKKITELPAYPIKYHAQEVEIKRKLTHRGQEWAKLCGVHHKQYNGLAYRNAQRVWVNGRIMVDRGTFAEGLLGGLLDIVSRDAHDADPLPVDGKNLKDDIMLATPIVNGFSLVDKRWFKFNVECVTDIEWNDDGFNNLAINPDRRALIKALVNSHANLKEKRSVDDFVTGKGVGLIVNLFGPPGVGKTLTVEATSEHLRKPLYVVSAGDLGTTPTYLEGELAKVFSLAPVWDAIVLIDEADVFLQERGTADVERNAMVAVFLRQLEYFQGILFLTTNRVKQFDPAFQSRIHLSLHYDDLSQSQKESLWRAFLEKTRTVGPGLSNLSTQQLQTLSRNNLNGWQIKNIIKLAVALAGEEETPLTYAHLVRTMDAADDWRSNPTATASLRTFWPVVVGVGIVFCIAATRLAVRK